MEILTKVYDITFSLELMEQGAVCKCIKEDEHFNERVVFKVLCGDHFYAVDWIKFTTIGCRCCSSLVNLVRGKVGMVLMKQDSSILYFLSEDEYKKNFKTITELTPEERERINIIKTLFRKNFSIEFAVYPKIKGENEIIYVGQIYRHGSLIICGINKKYYITNSVKGTLKLIQNTIKKERIKVYGMRYMIPDRNLFGLNSPHTTYESWCDLFFSATNARNHER